MVPSTSRYQDSTVLGHSSFGRKCTGVYKDCLKLFKAIKYKKNVL